MGLVGKLVLVLGVEGLAQWVIRAVVTFGVVSLLIVLIAIESVAVVLTGGQTGSGLRLRARQSLAHRMLFPRRPWHRCLT